MVVVGVIIAPTCASSRLLVLPVIASFDKSVGLLDGFRLVLGLDAD